MPRPPSAGKPPKRQVAVRLDEDSRAVVAEAARLRGLSVSEFVRDAAVGQARREVGAARDSVVVLTPEEQLELWKALQEKPALTDAQRRLSALIQARK